MAADKASISQLPFRRDLLQGVAREVLSLKRPYQAPCSRPEPTYRSRLIRTFPRTASKIARKACGEAADKGLFHHLPAHIGLVEMLPFEHHHAIVIDLDSVDAATEFELGEKIGSSPDLAEYRSLK
jgi:hypothetical protein